MKTKILADFEICISIPLKQFGLGNNLPMHIRENTVPLGKGLGNCQVL